MSKRRLLISMNKFYCYFLLCAVLPSTVHASFIESTIGTAVVNDATAAYYNPAALVLLKNSQMIPLGSVAFFRTRFTGQATQTATQFTETGSSSSHSHYYSPSFYLGIPVADKITIGFAVVSNVANRNVDDHSILRYVQASNDIQDYDFVPSIGFKINEFISLGAGVNFSYLDLNLQPITGVPGLNIADSGSDNDCDGAGIGGNIGLLLKFAPSTLIGFDYRSITTYHLNGSSTLNIDPQVVSNDYHFKLRTPARAILSINHFLTPQFGLMTTLQRVQWSIIKNININGIATLINARPVVINSSIPYYLHDTWVFVLGAHYRVTSKWVVRVAGGYNQSPGNSHYQIANGDSIILGASMGYEVNKTITIDASYAHAFMQNENINITNNRFSIHGVNEGSRDAVSLKLTFNI